MLIHTIDYKQIYGKQEKISELLIHVKLHKLAKHHEYNIDDLKLLLSLNFLYVVVGLNIHSDLTGCLKNHQNLHINF